jgi:hypothetical protein
MTFFPVYDDKGGIAPPLIPRTSVISDGPFCYSIVYIFLNYTAGSKKKALSNPIFQERNFEVQELKLGPRLGFTQNVRRFPPSIETPTCQTSELGYLNWYSNQTTG